MSWMLLAPAFLAGLAALAVPLILHLLRRQPTTVVDFPTLQFLREALRQKMRMNNLQRWLVLAARCLFLGLLALAFGRPFLAHLFQASSTALVVILDNSYSTRYDNQLNQAKAAALAKVRALPEGSLAGLILPLPRPKTVVALTSDREEVLRAIAQVAVSNAGDNYDTALRLADAQLRQAQCGDRLIYLVGDNQASAWQPVDFRRPLGPGVQLVVEPSLPRQHEEIVIDGVKIGAPLMAAGQKMVAHVQVHDYAQPAAGRGGDLAAATGTDVPEALQAATLLLELEGNSVAQLEISLHPGEVGMRDIEFTVPELKPTRGTVKIEGERSNGAAPVHFALNPTPIRRVGLWPPVTGGEVDPLAIALAPSPTMADLEPVELQDPADLARMDLLLIRPSGQQELAWEQAITGAIRGGKPTILLADASHETQLWMQDLGMKLADRPNRDDPLHLGAIDFHHAPLEKFAQPGSGDFFLAYFRNPPKFDPPADGHLIASFEDGSPAIFEKSIGQGSVLVVASGIQREVTNWTLLSTFVPFLHEVIKQLLPGEVDPGGILVGESLPGEVVQGDADAPGVAEVRVNDHSRLVAVNVDPGEFDLTAWSKPAQLEQLNSPQPTVAAPEKMAQTQYAETERAQMNWRYLLMAALLLLCSEMFLANRTAI